MARTKTAEKTTVTEAKKIVKDTQTVKKVTKVKVHFSKEKVQVETLINNLNKKKITKSSIKKEIPAEIKEVIDFAAHLQAMKKELVEYEEQLKEVTKALMKKYELNELVALLAKAKYSEYSSETFDKTLFKQEHPKMYKQYLGTQTKERFSIDLAK